MKKHKWRDVILAYQEMKEKHGYTCSYDSFRKFVSNGASETSKIHMVVSPAQIKVKTVKKKKAKRKLKPYKRAEYIEQKVQIDVKYVPSRCTVDGRKYYVYIAIDECSRWTFRQMYEEHNTYSSYQFLLSLIKVTPFPILRIQTDNGSEFTNALLVVKAKHKTLFEGALEKLGIEYQRIRIATPRHNGKVERQNRQDEERFYSKLKMYNRDDFFSVK